MSTSDGSGGSPSTPVEGYVEAREPPVPDVAYRVINPVVSLVLRSPLHSLLSDSLTLLTWTGRKSGREYTTPVGYWVHEGRVIVTTQSPWWHNFEGGGADVELRLCGERREGVATAYPDDGVVASYVQTYIDRHGLDAVRRLGVKVHGDREPTLAELEAGLDDLIVVEIELTDGDPPA